MSTKNIIIFLIIILVAGALIYFRTEGQEKTIEEVPKENVEEYLATQAGLPEVVEAKRQAIYKAAQSRDYDKLAALTSTPFHYSFGGPIEGGFAAYLKLAAETERKSAFDVIPILLKLDYAKQGNLYVWPEVFVKTAAEWTSEDSAQMRELLTLEEIEGYRKFGSYAYYRLGIREDGEWVYYIAGD
jgi:hypothetical protein